MVISEIIRNLKSNLMVYPDSLCAGKFPCAEFWKLPPNIALLHYSKWDTWILGHNLVHGYHTSLYLGNNAFCFITVAPYGCSMTERNVIASAIASWSVLNLVEVATGSKISPSNFPEICSIFWGKISPEYCPKDDTLPMLERFSICYLTALVRSM